MAAPPVFWSSPSEMGVSMDTPGTMQRAGTTFDDWIPATLHSQE
jgi:hypothetical protein